MSLAVVILSAGSSKDKMPGFPVFKTSPAFLPINSRSLGKIVIDFYLGEKIKSVYLAVNDSDFNAAQEEFGCYGDLVKILSISNSQSIVDTIEQTLPHVQESEVIFNIVTTIPKVLIPTTNCIGINEKMTNIEGWAGVKIENEELKFLTKKESYGQTGYSFSGIFRATKSAINQAVLTIKDDARKDLISVVTNIQKLHKISLVHFQWSDCGHTQNFFKTRAKIFGSRFFNSISLNTTTGILTKTSTNIAKLLRETSYVQNIPKELNVYFPRILSIVQTPDNVKVDMEYYAYPTLAEVMLYWDLPMSTWKDIFYNLNHTLKQFTHFPGKFKKNDWFEIYVHKVRERVSTFSTQLSTEEKKRLIENDLITINGQSYFSWNKINTHLEKMLEKIELPTDCSFIHGDYCFNNILCEPYVGLIKLLDPRGSFGENLIGVYGDRKYDWAKLGHSVIGRYDYIVNDLFNISVSNDKYSLQTYDRPWQNQLDKMFWESVTESQINKGIIKFIIGTLFISMPPLHADNPKRQRAFFLKGIEFLNAGLVECGVNLNE